MDVSGLRDAIETLKLYHRINNEKFEKNGKDKDILEKIYVDLLPNDGVLNKILLRNTTFLVGKRGTGKSTIIARAQHKIRQNKKNLSVYINAKTILETTKSTANFEDELKSILTREELKQLIMLKNFLSDFGRSLKEELTLEENNILESLKGLKTKYDINKVMSKIDKILERKNIINISKSFEQNVKEDTKNDLTLRSKIDFNKLNIEGSINVEDKQSIEVKEIFLRYLDINELINCIRELLNICKRQGIYVFIDDYSELAILDRKKFTEYIIEPFYHIAKDFMYLKVAAYPDQIEFGNLEARKYDYLSIDLYDIYGKSSITELEEKATDYIKRLIENRINVFSKERIQDIFDIYSFGSSDECFKMLFYASMCIPRELGIILDNCMISNLTHGKKINKTALLNASEKNYCDNIEKYYSRKLLAHDLDNKYKMDLILQKEIISEIIRHAQNNKKILAGIDNSYFKDLSDVPTSHFRINKSQEYILAPLEFNNYIFKVGELASKGKSSSLANNMESLYALNYGVCVYKKIIYGKPLDKDSKFYQQRVFNYTKIIKSVIENNKSIVCENGHTFGMEQLNIIKEFGMICPKCIKDTQNLVSCKEVFGIAFDEIDINEEIKWSEVEIDILSTIYDYQIRGTKNITASKIEGKIDISALSIGKRCQSLAADGFVNRYGSRPYSYTLTEEARQILEDSNLVNKDLKGNIQIQLI